MTTKEKTEELLKYKPTGKPEYINRFTPYAKEIANDVSKIRIRGRRPNTLFIGEAGSGKSVLTHALYVKSRESGNMPCNDFYRVNLHQASDISSLVGERYPNITNGQVDLPFRKGLFYLAVELGGLLAIEEANRGGDLTRVFNLMDYSEFFEVPEESATPLKVNPNLWIVGTMNPTGSEYTTKMMDKALDQRFSVKVKIDDKNPLVDEESMIHDILKDKAYTERMLAFATTCREDGNGTKLSVREVSNICSHISNGVDLIRSIEFVTTNAYSIEQVEQIKSTATIKFRVVEEK
jgi:MoxR-like ATPase